MQKKRSSSPAKIPFQQLIDALLDTEKPFRPLYLYRFSDLDAKELDLLKRAWPQVSDWRRQALMEDIEELGSQDTLLSFEALGRLAVQDEDPKVRLPAVRVLWESDALDLIPLFLDILRRDGDVEVRAAAATGLGQYIYLGELEEISADLLHEVEEALLNIMQNDDHLDVRRHALEALGYSSREEVTGLIETAYQTGNRDWLASALFAMGRSADRNWQPQVIEMLENRLPAIRMEAARAAGELELPDAAPLLIDLLDDPDSDVCEASIWSLSQIGGEGVREALERMFEETEDDEEAEFIGEALENLDFTEEMQRFVPFDLQEDEEEDEGWEGLEDIEDELSSEDDSGGKR